MLKTTENSAPRHTVSWLHDYIQSVMPCKVTELACHGKTVTLIVDIGNSLEGAIVTRTSAWLSVQAGATR